MSISPQDRVTFTSHSPAKPARVRSSRLKSEHPGLKAPNFWVIDARRPNVRTWTPATNDRIAYCIDVLDLFMAKCAANREKDREFNVVLLRAGVVEKWKRSTWHITTRRRAHPIQAIHVAVDRFPGRFPRMPVPCPGRVNSLHPNG